MRIATIIPVVLALMNGETTEVARSAQRRLSVCMDRGTDTEVEQHARALAAGIFAEIGAGMEWSCSGGSREAITIAISNSTPDKNFPGALAYAQPFADRILVFRDQIDKFLPQMRARVLTYMLAHEIAHVLEGIARHSDSGIMKAHWDRYDLREMFSMELKFYSVRCFADSPGIGCTLVSRGRWTTGECEVNRALK